MSPFFTQGSDCTPLLDACGLPHIAELERSSPPDSIFTEGNKENKDWSLPANHLPQTKDQAIDYAQQRACFRSGEIHILDSTGNVERIIPFDDANRKL